MHKKPIEPQAQPKKNESTVIVNNTNSNSDLSYELLLAGSDLFEEEQFKEKGFDTFGRNEMPNLAAIREEISDTLLNQSMEDAATYRREVPKFDKENLVDETTQSSLDMSSSRIPTRMGEQDKIPPQYAESMMLKTEIEKLKL